MTDDELKSLFDALRQESVDTRRLFSDNTERIGAENRHFFQATAEALRGDLQLVAEGLSGTREALIRETANIRDEMRIGFTETQAMIKFSHAELDRRVRALEESQRSVEQTLADVQMRLDRLETSTH